MSSEIPELPPKMDSPEQSVVIPKVASAHPFGAIASSAARQSPIILDPYQRAFSELQREANGVMTRQTEDEIFAALIQRAEELHQTAATDQDLEKTYHLLESLQRTRLVRRELPLRRPAATTNYGAPLAQNGQAQSGLTRQSIVPAYTPMAAQSDTLRAGVNVGGYDIVGRLGYFHPLPKGHPPYGVVDEEGQVICMISPSANLDLMSYVGKFVGINGVLGYYEEPGKSLARHFTARNIQIVR
jgi:hypothetical protein